jgi:hypothetical protein
MIPSSYGNLKNLHSLDIGNNHINGPIPIQWTSLNLSRCNLGYVCSLGGSFPNVCGPSSFCNESPIEYAAQTQLGRFEIALIVVSLVFCFISMSASLLYYYKNRNKVNKIGKLQDRPSGHAARSIANLYITSHGNIPISFTSRHSVGSGSDCRHSGMFGIPTQSRETPRASVHHDEYHLHFPIRVTGVGENQVADV